MDVSKFEGLENERWKYFVEGGMVRTPDFQSHIADVRGLGELVAKHGADEAFGSYAADNLATVVKELEDVANRVVKTE